LFLTKFQRLRGRLTEKVNLSRLQIWL